MEIYLNRLAAIVHHPQFCRAVAFGAWTLLGVAFVVGQFAFLGWVGPGPVFVFWSVAAAPLLAITVYWLWRRGARPPLHQVAIAGALWVALLVVAFVNPFTELCGQRPGPASSACLFFP